MGISRKMEERTGIVGERGREKKNERGEGTNIVFAYDKRGGRVSR